MGHIYIILFPNGKRYAGQTIQTTEQRMSQHFYPSKKDVHHPVHNAIRKYGQENVKVEHTFTLRCTQEYLDLMEDRAIIAFDTLVPNGYNIKRGGSSGAHLEETKRKISLSKKGKPNGCKGRPAPNKGKHHSKEARAKISAAGKGRRSGFLGQHHTEEARAKISAALSGHPGYWEGKPTPMKGRHHSEEAKLKMSIIKRGKHLSEETKRKISANSARKNRPAWNRGKPGTMMGRYHSEEAKAKMSASRKGRTLSEETKAKISQALKGKTKKKKNKPGEV